LLLLLLLLLLILCLFLLCFASPSCLGRTGECEGPGMLAVRRPVCGAGGVEGGRGLSVLLAVLPRRRGLVRRLDVASRYSERAATKLCALALETGLAELPRPFRCLPPSFSQPSRAERE
jgi:hypothetical protein